MLVYGKNVLKELNDNPNKIIKVYLSNNFKDQEIYDSINKLKINYVKVDKNILDHMINGNHQGIVMEINDYQYCELADIINENILIMLDHIEDPHNLGAIIRTCEAAGVKGMIIPKDRGAKVNDTVMKVSSGALSHVNICMVSNLNNTIDNLKKDGFFVYGADLKGKNFRTVDYSNKTCLIIGNEGKGMSELTKNKCDELVSIEMKGKVNSLNASVATGILVYDLINKVGKNDL